MGTPHSGAPPSGEHTRTGTSPTTLRNLGSFLYLCVLLLRFGYALGLTPLGAPPLLTLRRTNSNGNLPYNIREFLWMLLGTCLIWYLEGRNLSYMSYMVQMNDPPKMQDCSKKGKIPPKMEEPLLRWENKNLLIWNSLLECALPYQHSRFFGMSLMVFRIYLHIFVHPIGNIPIANSFVWTKSKNNLFFSYLCSKFVLAPPQYGKIEPYSFLHIHPSLDLPKWFKEHLLGHPT